MRAPVRKLEESLPACERANHVAGVHEVELFGEGPGFFGVVDDEFDVGWYPEGKILSIPIAIK